MEKIKILALLVVAIWSTLSCSAGGADDFLDSIKNLKIELVSDEADFPKLKVILSGIEGKVRLNELAFKYDYIINTNANFAGEGEGGPHVSIVSVSSMNMYSLKTFNNGDIVDVLEISNGMREGIIDFIKTIISEKSVKIEGMTYSVTFSGLAVQTDANGALLRKADIDSGEYKIPAAAFKSFYAEAEKLLKEEAVAEDGQNQLLRRQSVRVMPEGASGCPREF